MPVRCGVAGLAHGQVQLDAESLLLTPPTNFKVGFQSKSSNGNVAITEFVPVAQSVDAWTEMVTVQVFRAASGTAHGFLQSVGSGYVKACPDTTAKGIFTGNSNGYAVSMLVLTCPNNPATGKPEATIFRAIRGSDALYSVQHAWRALLLAFCLRCGGVHLRAMVYLARVVVPQAPVRGAQGMTQVAAHFNQKRAAAGPVAFGIGIGIACACLGAPVLRDEGLAGACLCEGHGWLIDGPTQVGLGGDTTTLPIQLSAEGFAFTYSFDCPNPPTSLTHPLEGIGAAGVGYRTEQATAHEHTEAVTGSGRLWRNKDPAPGHALVKFQRLL